MDCFASDASTLVGEPSPLKHAADVEYVKPEPVWDPAAAMRQHMRRKRDAEKLRNRSPLTDRVLAINRSADRSHSRSPARPYPHVSICRSFVKTGSCPYGAACSFEHPAPPRAPTPKVEAPPPPPPPPPAAPVQQPEQQPKTVYLPVPAVPPMFYSTYRRGSNGELIDPALLPAPVQAQKSLYYRTKPCRYWAQDGSCPKGDKCTFIHDPSLALPVTAAEPVAAPPLSRRPSIAPAPKPPREPHPAWRVVGGGVTLANARAQAGGNDPGADSEEEAAVECLTGLSASQQSQQSQPAYASQPSQAYAAQPAQAYATPVPQAYAAPLPSPVAPYPTFDHAAPYAAAPPPGQPLFAYAYPAPAYMWTPAPQPPPPEGFVYYVAPAPHAIEVGVPRVPAAVQALQDAGLDTSGLDGSGRPLDPDEGAQPLGYDPIDGWHGEEDETLEISDGAILADDMEAESSFPWGAVEKLSWADDVEMEEAEQRRAREDDGRRTSPTTPRAAPARLYELFAAAESP
ncbi:hypothetical protein AURDEDRAFT_116630 [Auricularia subglabra TFB-10046 SS5]|nr:hypothetical protein AURDEDRAFT_116630 [Auricularia subglabra TFB-10046 SS5]